MKIPTIKWILIGIVFLSSSLNGFSKGFKYTSEEGKMSITFPEEYKVETNYPEVGKTVKISATWNDIIFYASYVLHDTPLSDHEELANVGLEAFNESIEGKIDAQSSWVVKKNKGAQATLTMPSQNVTLNYYGILVGQIQYQLVVFAEKPKWNQAVADKFIKAFKLKK